MRFIKPPASTSLCWVVGGNERPPRDAHVLCRAESGVWGGAVGVTAPGATTLGESLEASAQHTQTSRPPSLSPGCPPAGHNILSPTSHVECTKQRYFNSSQSDAAHSGGTGCATATRWGTAERWGPCSYSDTVGGPQVRERSRHRGQRDRGLKHRRAESVVQKIRRVPARVEEQPEGTGNVLQRDGAWSAQIHHVA